MANLHRREVLGGLAAVMSSSFAGAQPTAVIATDLTPDASDLVVVGRQERVLDAHRVSRGIGRPGNEGLATERADVLARNSFGAAASRYDAQNFHMNGAQPRIAVTQGARRTILPYDRSRSIFRKCSANAFARTV